MQVETEGQDIRKAKIINVNGLESQEKEDYLSAEEPLEIRVIYGDSENRISKNISIMHLLLKLFS